MKMLVIITGLLGAFSMLAWAYVFYQVIQHGEWIAHEPIGWIIRTEFWMALAYALISLFCVGYAILKFDKS